MANRNNRGNSKPTESGTDATGASTCIPRTRSDRGELFSMRASQQHSPARGRHRDHCGQTELHHSRRVTLGQVQIPPSSSDGHLSSYMRTTTSDVRRRNRYLRTERTDESSTSFQKQVRNQWTHKSKIEILGEWFLENNIDIRCSRELGHGKYSKVIKGKFISSGHAIAIKMINTEDVSKMFRDRFLPREIECWKRLDHPHIIAMLSHYEAMQHVFFIMEYAPGGNMLQHVQKKGPVKERQAMIWMSQVISAVDYMHSRGIVHRDLKLENIVIFPEEGIIKITDFGFARTVNRGDALSDTFCGSRAYSAPEILEGDPYDPYKPDVWSVGVIAFVMVTDCMPYSQNYSPAQILEAQRLRDYEYPAQLNLSYKCRFSIDTMMTFLWRDRPSISRCSRLPWFQSLLPRSSQE